MRVTLRVTSNVLLGYSSDQGLTATNVTIPLNIRWYGDIYGVSGTIGLGYVVVGHCWIGLGRGGLVLDWFRGTGGTIGLDAL